MTAGTLNYKTVSLAGSNLIDAELSGVAWDSTSLTYAFPDSAADYSSGPEKDTGFAPATILIQNAAQFFLDTAFGSAANNGFAVEGFTNLSISGGSDTEANIRFAQSSMKNTAWAYYPDAGDQAGDTWYGTGPDYTTALQGEWKFTTIGHEIGHALGLKHGHETADGFPALAAKYDSQEYSIMTYRSYVGQEQLGAMIEQYGYPQTFMMSDIAALQYMYGANFTVNSGNTVYSWKPDSGNTWVNGKEAITNTGNVILATIWDGGGKHDTYDLSAYSDDLAIDLRPGKHSVFSEDQLSDLDWYSGAPGVHIARGSIFNALLYQGDTRSLIEDAVGGKGDDVLTGNQANNTLTGNAGKDQFRGLAGNDIYTGGGGSDIFYFAKRGDDDKITDFHSRQDKIDLQGYGFETYRQVKALETDSHKGVILDLGHGDTLLLSGIQIADLHARDFVL